MSKVRRKITENERGSIAYIMAGALLVLGLLGARFMNTNTFRAIVSEQATINSRAEQAIVAKGFNVWGVSTRGEKAFVGDSLMEDEIWAARKTLGEQGHSNPDESCYDMVYVFYGTLSPSISVTCDPADGIQSLLSYEDTTNAYCTTHSTPVQCYEAAEQALAEDPAKCWDYFLCQFNDSTETWSAIPMHLQF